MLNSHYACHKHQPCKKVDRPLTSSACLAGVCGCFGSLYDFLAVRDFEYDLKVTPLETELFDLTLEQIAVADVVVECAQREPFAAMCSF